MDPTLETFRCTVNHIKGEDKVAAAKLSRIPGPGPITQTVEIVQLAGENELVRETKQKSDSLRAGEGDECSGEHSLGQGEFVLPGSEMLREHQKGDSDC